MRRLLKCHNLIFLLTIILCLIRVKESQIHRASNKYDYQIKYDSNFTNNYLVKQMNLDAANESVTNMSSANGSLSFYAFKFTQEHENLLVWMTTLIGTFFVGICGIVPVLVLPQLAHDHHKLIKSALFKCLVSFAGGSLIGDVFIHLLPEAYSKRAQNDKHQELANGLWLIFGLLTFFSIEKLFPDDDDKIQEPVQIEPKRKETKKINQRKRSGAVEKKQHGETQLDSNQPHKKIGDSIKTIGFLNLFANVIDNFTHGIAVAGSFQASVKFGIMTLIATLLHEIPHEIGDFVILLKSGLNYKQAALAQLITAFAGIIGAIFALSWSSAERAGDVTSWILPFTSGGFLYISMVNIMPDLITVGDDWRLNLKQIFFVFFGIIVIYVFNFFL